LPNPAFFEAVIVIVELPAPEPMLAGLKDALRPPPAEADSDTFELNPFTPATVTVLVVVPLRRIELGAGAVAVSAKSAAGVEELTVTDTDVVWVTFPPVAVMVKLYVPAAVPAGTVNVATELPAPPTIGFVPNCTVIPLAGLEPEADSVTSELNPPDTAVLIVEIGAAPCVLLTCAETDEGEALRLKSGLLCVPPVSAAINPAFGLPHPVTRSYPVTAL
jgi:hypothetical protein